jgi:hypothetical protein
MDGESDRSYRSIENSHEVLREANDFGFNLREQLADRPL